MSVTITPSDSLHAQCPFCGFAWFSDFTTNLFQSDLELFMPLIPICESHQFYSSCPRCSLQFFGSTSKRNLLGFCRPGLVFKEPSHHFDRIILMLKKLDFAFNSQLLFTCSTKDCSLSSYLTEHISSYQGGDSLTLCRRFIEHINSAQYISNLLESIPDDGYLLIESIDYGSMSSNNNLSFIWDERLSYPSCTQICQLFYKYRLILSDSVYIDDDIPFYVLIFRKSSLKQNILIPNFAASRIKLFHDIMRLLDHISSRIVGLKSLAFIGINNYSLHFGFSFVH